jgi:F0F1-type ATP synthase delta subunit
MRTATITAPRSLSDATYKALCDGIESARGESFAFSRAEDDTILGGFILNIEGEVHDRSILSQLKLLRAHLSEQA